jgi:hypothetical protein
MVKRVELFPDANNPKSISADVRRTALLPVVAGMESGRVLADAALSSFDSMALTPSSGMLAVAGMIGAYGTAQAQQAAAIQQQTSYMLQARDNLTVAEVRAEMSDQYAQIQAGRILKKSQLEAQNYRIAGNQLLKNLRATNATARARAAASGISFGEGSALSVQTENVRNVMMDVDIFDLNALTAQVLGFEDAAAMIQSTEYQNFLNVFSAQRQAGQFEQAGKAARQQGGLLAGATLGKGVVDVATTFSGSRPSGMKARPEVPLD